MATDNPAGRLYVLLDAAHRLESDSVAIRTVWAKVLEVDEANVSYALAEWAGLLDDIARLVRRVDDPVVNDAIQHWGPVWANVLFLPSQATSVGSTGLVDAGALSTLGMVAGLLSQSAPEGVLPDDAALEGLTVAIVDALAAVKADTTLPAEVAAILVARLHDMLWAVDHLATVGAEGVTAAAERLAGRFPLPGDGQVRHPIVAKVMAVAGMAWAVFKVGREVPEALEGWKQAATQITGG